MLELPVKDNGFTWIQEFERIIKEEVKPKLPMKLNLVLLTGGGSRMDFVRNHCEALFKCRVELGDNPSFMIAQGLAGYGRYVYRIKKFREEIENLCNKELKPEIRTHASGFAERFMEVLRENMFSKVATPFYKKLKRGEIKTAKIADMNKYFLDQFILWLNSSEGKTSRLKITGDLEIKLNEWLKKKTNKLEEKYKIEAGKLRLKFEIESDFFAPENDLMGQVAEFVSFVLARILKVLDKIIPLNLRKIVPDWVIDITMASQEVIFKNISIPILQALELDKQKISEKGTNIFTEKIYEEVYTQLQLKADEAEAFIK